MDTIDAAMTGFEARETVYVGAPPSIRAVAPIGLAVAGFATPGATPPRRDPPWQGMGSRNVEPMPGEST